MTVDVAVVGAGHNGLVAALELAKGGLEVAVLERNAQPGGAVASGELTVPGVVHDLFATNQNLFLASPAFGAHEGDLERLGVRFAVTDKPFSSAFPDGRSLRVYRDTERTLAGLREHDPADADGWLALAARFDRWAPLLFELYGTPLASRAAAARVARGLRAHGAHGLQELGGLLLSSTRELAEAWFRSPEAQALVVPWGMHLDFGPDVAGGAMFPFLETFADQANGLAVVEGGAGRLPAALAELVREHGGSVRTETEVTRIPLRDGRASGVELAGGETIDARVAVLANVAPPLVFGGLVDGADERVVRRAHGYRFGPATMVVHLALRGPIPWAAGGDLHEFGYVHLGPYVDDMARTYAQSMAGLLPDEPLLVVGQTTAIDPTRAPAGTHVVWIQVRTLPPRIAGDAAGTIGARTWAEAKRPFAERVLDKLERHAPGVRDAVLGIAVLGPDDLERHDPNLVGGDSLGGSHHLRQNFVLRPFAGATRYATPVPGLWLCGAGTWPGAGVNAVSGHLAAHAIIARARTPAQRARRLLRRA